MPNAIAPLSIAAVIVAAAALVMNAASEQRQLQADIVLLARKSLASPGGDKQAEVCRQQKRVAFHAASVMAMTGQDTTWVKDSMRCDPP